ncbi:PAS domain S-box protein [Pseudomonas sp. NPDC090208]|uniref:PAS domain S-box protein n=1 Tax=Pseudomonas sp. NPDC090208 TaxID=3364478 RepID=UPI0038239648
MRLMSSCREAVLCVAVIVGVGLTVTGILQAWVRAANDRQLTKAVHVAADEAAAHVLERVGDYQYGLRGIRGAVMMANPETLDYASFKRYFQGRGADAEFDSVYGYGFIRRIAGDQLDAFAAHAGKEYGDSFQLRQFEPHAGERFIVQYIEPLPQNSEGLGLDIASEPRRRAAAEAAMRSGEPRLTAPVSLRTSNAPDLPSMLLLMPVYQSGLSLTDEAAREQAVIGWAFSALIMNDVFHDLKLRSGIRLEIADVTEDAQAPAFFSRGLIPNDAEVVSTLVTDQQVYGRHWRFRTTAGPVFLKGLHLVSPAMILIAGILFTALLSISGALWVMSAMRRNRLIRERTHLAAIVESSTDGIISKNLDGVVTSWNRGAEDIFGYRADEAIGRRIDTLIIPPDRLREETDILDKISRGIPISNFDTVRRRKNGTLVDVSVNISPLIGVRGEFVGASKTVRNITRQKQAEARILELNASLEEQIAERTSQLRDTNLMLSSVLRAATEVAIIATGRDGLIQIFNAGAERMLGYTADELIGRTTPKQFHLKEELAQRAMKDLNVAISEIDEFESLVGQCKTEGASTREWTFVRKDGSQFPVTLMVTEIRNEQGELTGYLGIAVDITRREAAQKELTAARDQLLMAAEVAQLGIWSWDFQRNELQWNDRMFEFYFQPTQLREEGLCFTHWLERVHPEDQARMDEQLKAMMRGEKIEGGTFRVLGTQGQLRIIQSEAYLERDTKGDPLRATGINLDVTAQLELQARLLDAKDKADAASEAKSTFLANMSHEIRTPMNAVLGMMQLLEQTRMDSRQAGYVANARIAARSLLSLLNDILDYSKIEAGKLQLEVHPFDLDLLLRELAAVLLGNQSGKAVEVLFELDPQVPIHLRGDSLRLQQVLINLAGNALKFTPSGQVVVRFKCIHSDQPLRIRVEVEDSGIGISQEQIAHIFEGFSQAQASTSRRYGGTGLGLAICKRLVSMMGGELQVRSEVEVGSCFWFDIDMLRSEVPAPGIPQRIEPGPLRLLVVDDNDFAREILSGMIQALGWSVDAVASGVQALQRICDHSGGASYDVVLLDWSMPEMNGLAVARAISQCSTDDHAPAVILVTAYSQDVLGQLDAADATLFDGLLSKPLTPLQLAQAVDAALNPERFAEPARPASLTRTGALTGLNLLVVEDNPLNRQVAMELLMQEGASVELADGGLSGVQRVVQGQNRIDAVLMDVQMPDIDGYEATRRIRNDPRFHDLPIIAMTANASREDQMTSLAVGMNAHLAKPIDLPQVVAAILRCLGKTAPTVQLPAVHEEGDIEPWVSICERFGGNQALLQKLLVQFGADVHGSIAQLRKTIADDDPVGAKRILHMIKGTAGNLGARAVSVMAGDLERQVNRDADRLLHERVTEQDITLMEQLAKTSVQQLTAFTSRAASPVGREALTNDEFRKHLEVILPLLEGHDLRGVTLTESLDKYQLPCLPQAWGRLSECLSTLNFKSAVIVVRELLQG